MPAGRDIAMQDRHRITPSVFWLMFALDGRIARKSYILGQLLILAVLGVIITRIVATTQDTPAFTLWGLIMLIALVVSCWCSIALVVKRLHDLGFNGFFAVILFVPMVGPLALFALMLVPSKNCDNRWGPPPFGIRSKLGPGPENHHG